MNPIVGLVKSRKFWVTFAAVAATFSVVFFGKVPPDQAGPMVIGALGLVATLVGATAYEDAKTKENAAAAANLAARVAVVAEPLKEPSKLTTGELVQMTKDLAAVVKERPAPAPEPAPVVPTGPASGPPPAL